MAIPELVVVWREESCWSRAANRMKQRIERGWLVALVFVVGVAVLATTAMALAEVGTGAGLGACWCGRGGAAVLPALRSAWSAA